MFDHSKDNFIEAVGLTKDEWNSLDTDQLLADIVSGGEITDKKILYLATLMGISMKECKKVSPLGFALTQFASRKNPNEPRKLSEIIEMWYNILQTKRDNPEIIIELIKQFCVHIMLPTFRRL